MAFSDRGERWLCGGALARKAVAGTTYAALRAACFEAEEDAAAGRVDAAAACGGCGSCQRCCPLRPTRRVEAQVFDTILKDVPRSFGRSLQKLDTPQLRLDLIEVLVVLAFYEKDVGYTQGMNFIGVAALTEMDKEHAFWLMVDIVESLPKGFFARTARDEVELFQEIVSTHLPHLRQHLIKSNQGDPDQETFKRAMGYLLVRWMIALFVHGVPLKTTKVLWDFLFVRKKVSHDCDDRETMVLLLHRIAFALVEIHAGPLLSTHRRVEHSRDRLKNSKGSSSDFSASSDENLDKHIFALNDKLDSFSGVGFIQCLLSSVAKDTNPHRIIKLAKSMTIDSVWLNGLREAKGLNDVHDENFHGDDADDNEMNRPNQKILIQRGPMKESDQFTSPKSSPSLTSSTSSSSLCRRHAPPPSIHKDVGDSETDYSVGTPTSSASSIPTWGRETLSMSVCSTPTSSMTDSTSHTGPYIFHKKSQGSDDGRGGSSPDDFFGSLSCAGARKKGENKRHKTKTIQQEEHNEEECKIF